ncbi:peptidylprolyl isomerase [Holosporaceae bacterium 'Namur']|nr:peptidylprolyl isomerase [Holosporaceae bacterium 'Namur']
MKKILLFIFIAFYQLSYAAEQAVVAVINHMPITDLDLNRRIELVVKSNNLPHNPKALEALKFQVLQMLIDEKLFEQEAKKLNIIVDEIDIKRAFHTIAANNNLKISQLDAFLKNSGISQDELENQIKHQLLWSKLIKTQIEPFVAVTEQDIKDSPLLQKTHSTTRDEDRVRLAEIAIFTGTNNIEEAKDLIEQLADQIKNGADFAKLAKNFSQSSSAAKSGEIGWFYIKQLSSEFAEAVINLKPGEISKPIIMNDSVYIIKVLDRKTAPQQKEDLPHSNLAKDEELKESLKQRKLDNRVKAYLLKLRNQAFIDLK